MSLSELLFVVSPAVPVMHEEACQSLQQNLPAKTALWLALANRAKLEIRRELKTKHQAENVKGVVDELERFLGRVRAIRRGAPVLPSAVGALVLLMADGRALGDREFGQALLADCGVRLESTC